MTTFEIACARRVPTFRNRSSRPGGSGNFTWRISSSGASAVLRYDDEVVERGDLALAALPADEDHRVRREEDRQRVARR